MKFKPGDKVRVRQWKAMERNYGLDEHGNINHWPAFIKEMSFLCGKEVTIDAVLEEKVYTIKEDSRRFEWADYMFEGYAFEYGDLIEVSDNGKNWYRYIYVSYIDGNEYPYCVASETEFRLLKFRAKYFRHARPLQRRHTITIDGKDIDISEESYQNLKKALLENTNC